jgi:hypothetical protein
MNLDDDEIKAAYYGLCGFVRQRVLAGRPVPPEVLRVRHRFDAHVRLSSTRHETGCGANPPTQSEVWIGAAATASALGKSGTAGLRWVQRHAEQLGGQLIGGRYVFRESQIIDFIDRRAHATCGTTPRS